MRTTHIISLVLAIIGAINWGLVGLFEFDLVASLFGVMSPASRIVYVLVGLAGVILIFTSPVLLNPGRTTYSTSTPNRPFPTA